MKAGYYWHRYFGRDNWEICRVQTPSENYPLYTISFTSNDGFDTVEEKDLSTYAEFKGPLEEPKC